MYVIFARMGFKFFAVEAYSKCSNLLFCRTAQPQMQFWSVVTVCYNYLSRNSQIAALVRSFTCST